MEAQANYTPPPTPATGQLLPPERLAAISRCQQGAVEYTKDETGLQSQAKQYAEDIGDLLAHITALTARAEAAEARLAQEGEQERELLAAGQRAEDATATVRELLAEFYAGGTMAQVGVFCKDPRFIDGVNAEREQNNNWVKMRCAELGIEFPPQQRPAKGFEGPATLPTPGAEGKEGQDNG